MGGCVIGGCISLGFFSTSKKRNEWYRGYPCEAWRTVRGPCDNLWWSVMVGGEWFKKEQF